MDVLHAEIEMMRKKECSENGKKAIFKLTCLARDETRRGQAENKIEWSNCTLFTTVRSLNSSPYSVSLNDSNKPHCHIDFLPTEIKDVYKAIFKVMKCGEKCVCDPRCVVHSTFDVPVWGGRDILRLTRAGDKGFYICQVNFRSIKKKIKDAGFHEKMVPKHPDASIYVPASHVFLFRRILLLTNNCVKLQWEVLSQQHATFKLVSKLSSFSSYNREKYYWLVMNTFFNLEINP